MVFESYAKRNLDEDAAFGGEVFHRSSQKPSGTVLHQVHGTDGFEVDLNDDISNKEGDFLWTTTSTRIGVCVADCTAILVSGYCESRQSGFVAAIHAGWRGSAQGIIEAAFSKWESASNLRVWLSPSICQDHFEVGPEVREAFPLSATSYFREQQASDRLYFDLRGFQKEQIKKFTDDIREWAACTIETPTLPSYRRDGPARDQRLYWWIERSS